MKKQLFKSLIYFTCLYLLLYQSLGYCTDYNSEVQTVTITKEDILNSIPTPAPVLFDKKEMKYIEIMEKRHFERTYPELTDQERLKNLEWELLGKIWVYTPQKSRIDRLKLASSNRMIAGMALPPSLSSRRTARRLKNDSIQMRQKDDIGLIDGFLRLINPNAYEVYKNASDNLFLKYDSEY